MGLLLLRLAALLVGTPLSTAQHVNFYRMSSNGCATGVKSDTGYSAPVIKYVWTCKAPGLIARGRAGAPLIAESTGGGSSLLAGSKARGGGSQPHGQ